MLISKLYCLPEIQKAVIYIGLIFSAAGSLKYDVAEWLKKYSKKF